MRLVELREKIPNDIFTSLELNVLLSGYSNKRCKIASMLKKGEIIQLRRGLYTFPTVLRHEPLSMGVLANSLYGPSYVSEDFALSYYGLIPEVPCLVTSISLGRSRNFCTPYGTFAYRHCHSCCYSVGITRQGTGRNCFLIATPEKALFDKILHDRRFDGGDIIQYLYEDLRLEEDMLQQLDRNILHELAPFARGRLRSLWQYLEVL